MKVTFIPNVIGGTLGNKVKTVPSVNMQRSQHERPIPFDEYVGGKELRSLLGYRTASAFRQAVYRGTLPVPTTRIHGRRDRIAKRSEVEDWLRKVQVSLGHLNDESVP